MSNEVINNQLQITVPDGFRILTKEEMKAMYLDDNPDRWGMRNDEMHHTVAVLADAKGIAESTQMKLSAGLSAYQYQKGKFFPAMVSGKDAYGFTYRYVNHGVPTDGTVLVFKNKNICYTVYDYSAEDFTEANRSVFEEICSSLKL